MRGQLTGSGGQPWPVTNLAEHVEAWLVCLGAWNAYGDKMIVPWGHQPPSPSTLHADVCGEFISACFKEGRPRDWGPFHFCPEQPRNPQQPGDPQFLGASRGASGSKTVLIMSRCASGLSPVLDQWLPSQSRQN